MRPLPHIAAPLDAYAPLEPVTSCDPSPKPGMVAFRDWILGTWGGDDWGIMRSCEPGAVTSRHQEGRAWDWRPPSTEAGDAFVAWLLAPDPTTGEPHGIARRAGIRSIIWRRRIWTAAGPWRPYSGRSDHTDHVHIDISWAAARGETSLYAEIATGNNAGDDIVIADERPTVEEAGSRCIELPAVRGLASTSESFRRRLLEVAADRGLNPAYLAAVISFETGGTFRPDIRNPYSGFVGLIQFGPAAAAAIGTTLARLGNMTAAEQMTYVGAYYAKTGTKPRTLCDHYLAVFAPAFVGREPGATVYAAPTKAYAQNANLDKEEKGYITVADACAPVTAILAAAADEPPILVGVSPTLADRLALAGLLLSIATALVLSLDLL